MIRTIHLPTGAAALPPSVRARLEDPPRPGTGVHNWIYGTALAMLNFVSADECVELLRECIPRKPKPYNEIEMQVQSALDMRESGQTVSRKRRPEFPMDENSPCKVLEKARSGLDIDYLRSLNPKSVVPDIPAKEIQEILHPHNPLICAGQFFGRPVTARLSEFHPRFLSNCSFVVPHPMTALTGITQRGRVSARSESNVGSRRWAVIEADIKQDNELWASVLTEAASLGISDQDLGAALLLTVAEESAVPLTAAVHSASVSEHGWFYVANMSYDEQERLYRIGAKWGGDPATWTINQWVRMPNGTRWKEDEDRSRPATLIGPQRLEYFRPPILNFMSKITINGNGGNPAKSTNGKLRFDPRMIDMDAVQKQLEQEEEEHRNQQPLSSPPKIAVGPSPAPDVRRYRLSEDGWSIEEDWDSPQKGTVPYDILFDGTRYWHLHGEHWYDLNTEATKLALVGRYELNKSRLADQNNELDSAIAFINQYNRIASVYAIGGYSAGLYCIAAGQMLLVPTGFNMIKADPKAGCYRLLRLLRQMLPVDPAGKDQFRYLLSMWKVRRQSLMDRSFPLQQLQVFIGPKNCGKTLTQEQIITPLFGGREAEPFAYLSGATRFNNDLFAAEHLKMSDEIATSDSDKRREFGTKIKALIFNTSKRLEGKGATPVTIKHSFGHVTISANDEPEDVKGLPLLTDSTIDKISLFKCVKPKKALPTFAKRKEFGIQLANQLPALAAFLDRFEIPKEMQTTDEANRCGVNTYRHPELQQMLHGQSPEHRFFEAMEVVFNPDSHLS
jgi:hypothetical protein